MMGGGGTVDEANEASPAAVYHTSILMRNKHLWRVQAAKVCQSVTFASGMERECQWDISIPGGTPNDKQTRGSRFSEARAPPVQTNLNLGDMRVIHQTGSVAWNRSSACHQKLSCM